MVKAVEWKTFILNILNKELNRNIDVYKQISNYLVTETPGVKEGEVEELGSEQLLILQEF